MKTTIRALPVLLLALFAAACGGQEGDTTSEDNVQEVDITITDEGFSPERIELEAGTPARLVFTRETENTCATTVKIPELDVAETDLPMNEPVALEFTPGESGQYTFTCGMGMAGGVLVVRS